MGEEEKSWADQIPGLERWATRIDEGVRHHHGTTVVLYNQALDIRTKCGGRFVEGGWCRAMSVYWIIKTARGESFWDWFHPPIQACPNLKDRNQGAGTGEPFIRLRELMRAEDQKKREFEIELRGPLTDQAAKAVNDWWTPKVTHGSPCLRDFSGDGDLRPALNGRAIAGLLVRRPGYKLLAALGSEGGHAMAARIVDGTVVFMDPNYGEFFFPSLTNFENFMNAFWRKAYAKKLSTVAYVTSFTDPEIMKYG